MITQKLAEFVCSTGYDALPSQVVHQAKRGVLDCVGVILAGLPDRNSAIAREFVTEEGGKAEATVFGSDVKVPACNAAFANGIASHAIDFDDYSPVMIGHPSVISLPPALAIGEATGASGKDLILSYVLGGEVASRLAAALTDKQYARGWHNTATMGTFGATATAGKLLGLDEGELAYAFGIAASMAAGLKRNFGTSCKPYHVGQACSNGIKAAILAKKGFTSALDIVESDMGLASVLSGSLVPEAIDKLGRPFVIDKPGYSAKLYPSCAFTHSSIDGILELKKKYGFSGADVSRIESGISQAVVDTVIYGPAKTPLEGKFSMPFCLSVSALFAQVTPSDFSAAVCRNPEVVALMDKVSMHVDPAIAARGYSDNGALVKVVLKDGTKLETEVKRPKGDCESPLSDSDLLAKYKACATPQIGGEACEESYRLITGLEELASVSSLSDSLTPVQAVRT